MDERTLRRWRDRLRRALARRLKAWAEAALAASSGSEPAPRLQVPPPEGAPPPGPPAGWLKQLQGVRVGPPTDWVAFVRRHAGHTAARLVNRRSAPRRALAESPADASGRLAACEARTQQGASVLAPPPPWREGSTRPSTALEEPALPKGSPARGKGPLDSRQEQRSGMHPASALETPGAFAPRAVPAPVFQELQEVSPMVRPLLRAEPRAGSQVPLYVPRAAAPRPASSERAGSAELNAHLPRRAEPREWTPTAFPWSEEPAEERPRAPEPPPQEDLSTLLERTWPGLEEDEELPLASPAGDAERPEIHWVGPWPELPEASPVEPAEALALLRQWERLSRLEREQRGE